MRHRHNNYKWIRITYLRLSGSHIKTNKLGSRFTKGLRSRIFGCKSNRRKTSAI